MDFAYQWPRYFELVDTRLSQGIWLFFLTLVSCWLLYKVLFNQIIMKTLINSCGEMAL